MHNYHFFGPIYRQLIKPILFRFDPEFVHDQITLVGIILGSNPRTRFVTKLFFSYNNPALEQTVAGIKFRNPVGLSAGFDKDARLTKILPEVGFGFMELGSVTYQSYAGNPQPRLTRLPKSKGLVVYYGLKNEGVHRIVARLKAAGQNKSIVGISIAKTNSSTTATEYGGIEDYFHTAKYLEEQNVGDYYTINISCPNTFGGEPFTTKERLDNLLSKLDELKISKPVFVKMPINLPVPEFDSLLQICIQHQITGVLIGNLTKARDPALIHDPLPERVKGGISGKPTEALCNQLIEYTYRRYRKELVIVGVGGIFSAEDAYTKIKLGASVVQLITGMIFEGPQLVGEINKGLVELLKKDGYTNISQAIGASMVDIN